MMKIIKISWVLIGFCLLIAPLIYWALNSELTQMQFFLKTWFIYLIGAAFIISGTFMDLKKSK